MKTASALRNDTEPREAGAPAPTLQPVVGLTLTAHWIEEIRARANQESWRVLTFSKYFSRLKSADDYVVLVDSLEGLLQAILEADARHVVQLEEAKQLFVRWYCYGERSEGLKKALREHLNGDAFGEGADNMSKANRLANVRPLGMWQYLPIETQKSVQSLREMRHSSGSFGIMYLTPMLVPSELEANPARFLGLQRQPVDFVHYAQPDARPYIDFRESQITYIVERTLAFAAQVLAQWSDMEALERQAREHQTVKSLRMRVRHQREERRQAGKSGWDESDDAVQQILAAVDHAAQLKSSFMGFVIGWLQAVDHAFKRHL